MSHFVSTQTYRLGAGALECDANGLRLRGNSLLARAQDHWVVGTPTMIELALRNAYDEQFDATTKIAGLNAIARSLNDGDLAKAQVAALLLKFPDPADLPSERTDKAAILKAAGWMLKEWDPDKHPRTGTTPNAGWFAPVDEGATGPAPAATHGTQSPNPSKVTWDDKMQACHEQCVHLTLQRDGITYYRRCMRECLGGPNADY